MGVFDSIRKDGNYYPKRSDRTRAELDAKKAKFARGDYSYAGKGKSSRRRQRAESYISNVISPRVQELYGKSRGELERARGEVDEGYANALRETENLNVNNSRNILERQQQLGGQIAQNATNRGLSGTSFAADQSRGLEYDTQRQLSDSNARFAGMRAQLYIGRGQAQAQSSQALAQNYNLQFGAEQNSVYQNFLSVTGGLRDRAYRPRQQSSTSRAIGSVAGIAAGIAGL